MKTPKQAVERALKLARRVTRQAYIDAFDARQMKESLRLLRMLDRLETYGYRNGGKS